MNTGKALMVLAAIAMLTACNKAPDQPEPSTSAAVVFVDCPAPNDSGYIDIAPGLTARILEKGYGRAAAVGDYADTNVWLWQLDETAADRRGEFIWESGDDVFQFRLGSGQVIKGWDLGVPCMLEGEKRELVVASDLAYGAAGRGDAIPPNTPLIFTIELMRLKTPE